MTDIISNYSLHHRSKNVLSLHYLLSGTPEPTDITIKVDYGDGTAVEILIPNQITFTAYNGGFKFVFPTPHVYRQGGDYVISVQLWNQVSAANLTHSHRVVEHIKDLTLAHIFSMDHTLSDDCYAMEDTITFNATFARGTHMNVTWDFGDGDTKVRYAYIVFIRIGAPGAKTKSGGYLI